MFAYEQCEHVGLSRRARLITLVVACALAMAPTMGCASSTTSEGNETTSAASADDSSASQDATSSSDEPAQTDDTCIDGDDIVLK